MVIELMPTSPDGYYHKGFALFQLQDYQAAVSDSFSVMVTLRGSEERGVGGGPSTRGGGGQHTCNCHHSINRGECSSVKPATGRTTISAVQ
jgi:hypothetical protein